MKETTETESVLAPTLRLQDRVGCFAIDWQCFEDYRTEAILFKILATVLIVRADADFASRQIEYTAYCHQFEPVAPGISPARYAVRVDPESGAVRWAKSDFLFGAEISLGNILLFAKFEEPRP